LFVCLLYQHEKREKKKKTEKNTFAIIYLQISYHAFIHVRGGIDRHVVSAIVSVGMGAGISVGQGVAGFLGPIYGWRLPFLVISVPALFCAALVYFTVNDPERGAMERVSNEYMTDDDGGGIEDGDGIALVPIASYRNDTDQACDSVMIDQTQLKSSNNFDDTNNSYEINRSIPAWKYHLKTTLNLLKTPTVALSLFQGAPGCVPWGIINTFLNDYLSENRGFSVQGATAILMCFSTGVALGIIAGGAGGRALYKIDIRLPALLAGGTAIMACFPLWFLINGVDSTTPYYIAILSAIVAGFGSGPTGPIIKATLTNVTLPNTRGKAFALFNVFDDFGKGLGPYLVSLLIVKFGGRTRAFNIGVSFWILCGLANLAIFFTVVRDEQRVQTALRRS
jgi:predicted MFS family arabinose efflux permease